MFDVISQASQEISTGNQDLAQRTAAQAASLDEAAHSVEKLTPMVRKNTERALAQGSALAAREIKDLISNSLQTVDEGTTLVNHAGETMDKIVASISNVTQIMSGMASASSEQSAGVA